MIQNKKPKKVNHNKIFSNEDSRHYYDMVVFCHLGWQSVYQRPQHIISRLSARFKILFIELPILNMANPNSGNFTWVNDNLHVLQPHVKNVEAIAGIIKKYVKNSSIPIGWFYSALFSPLLQHLNFKTVVYDCMDEPCLIDDGSKHLIDQENFLMAHADIVFTNGKSLYESKKQNHSNVYCFPGSVDESHFAEALNSITVPEDIAHIQSPIVGYYGIIDERIDFDLLHQTALQLPNVAFVMTGFLAEGTHLPQEANIHYLGMKSYDELPYYLKAFDIAMMPFALNYATKYTSSAKTLEYMAAGKPIISTKINHVVRDYNICVSLIETADEFSKAITFLLDKLDRLSLEVEYYNILKKTSWDATADKMIDVIKTLAKGNTHNFNYVSK